MNTIEIIKAKVSDLEIIQKISIQTFIETFAAVNTPENIDNYVKNNLNTAQLTTELNNINSQFYLAYLNEEVVGYLKINFGEAQTETINDNALEIQRIYVLQNFHGKNIGQLLLNEVKKIGQNINVDYIWLGVWEENHRALRFYTKNSFVVFDKHVFMMGNEKQTDLLMQLLIK
ncbi:GNAT family N-acetyltransferase [Flavobacterium sp. LB3R33]|uniref:GNAT family N-acetyltransferase n=1 Tax=Flavobacterium sp. LB3R33 TaxID=3401721 RepID=UPI003AAAA59D